MATRNQVPAVSEGDIIGWQEAGTLWGLFCERVRRSPHAIGYREYDPGAGKWGEHTWCSIATRVDRIRSAFASEGLTPGDHIAVLLPNGIDWVSFDLAAHGSGLVVIGLYPHDTAASNAAILGHSDARLVLLDKETRWRSLLAFHSQFPLLRYVWIRDAESDPPSLPTGATLRSFVNVLENQWSQPLCHRAVPRDTATLIYTSGTTGRPKGVMLSHFALLWNAATPGEVIPPRSDDVFLSVLPLAHAFARTADYYLPMMGGCTVAYARSPKELREDFSAIRPTVLFGVPFLFDQLAGAILRKVEGSFTKHGLLRLAAFVGWQLFRIAQRRGNLGPVGRLLLSLFKRSVAVPVLAAFGGRLRVVVSGGAPLDQGVAQLLIGLGLPLVEGYGLTEAGPVVAVNALDDNLPGSVGRPLRGVEVKLGLEGELLVRSPSMMTGYWKDDAETMRALSPNGWLSTGDLAEIKDGHIYIRGRLKYAIVLSIGEKINPNVVEAEITCDPLFEQAMVIGNRRPYLVALIVLNTLKWKSFAERNRITPEEPNQHASKAAILGRLTRCLSHLPWFAQIRAVHLTLTPWTVEAGLLTPTLKSKRDALQQKFAKEIEALYPKR
ncbi:MAG TPA: AMP-dependent synthetase/ligase [Methylocella sp.]|nr:AMP-dependent synthetase/ligase [Methylocella sp.]